MVSGCMLESYGVVLKSGSLFHLVPKVLNSVHIMARKGTGVCCDGFGHIPSLFNSSNLWHSLSSV